MLSSGGVGVSGVRGGGGGGGAESDAGEAAGGGDLTLQQFLHLEREVNGRVQCLEEQAHSQKVLSLATLVTSL